MDFDGWSYLFLHISISSLALNNGFDLFLPVFYVLAPLWSGNSISFVMLMWLKQIKRDYKADILCKKNFFRIVFEVDPRHFQGNF